MWALKILKFIGKLILKILLIPVILIVALLSVFVKILAHIGAFVAGIFILFLLGCVIWTAAHQLWSQTGLLAAIGACSIGAVFGAGMLEVLLDSAAAALAGLMAH